MMESSVTNTFPVKIGIVCVWCAPEHLLPQLLEAAVHLTQWDLPVAWLSICARHER